MLLIFLECSSVVVGEEKFRMWGPGLRPHKEILPCRYFFVGSTEYDDSALFKTFLDKENLQVDIEGLGDNNRICRPHKEILPTRFGFIVRYKIFYTCRDIRISVKINKEHISGSPVTINEASHADTCDCPLDSLDEWVSENTCTMPPKQIEDDLEYYEKNGVDMSEVLDKAKKTLNQRGSQCWCHYAIKDGEIFRECFGQHVGFSMFWDNVLSWLSRRAALPDLEMLVNLGDWPLIKSSSDRSIPMFSWCGSQTTHDMVFPTYELTEASLECMGRQSLDVLASMGKNEIEWEKKSEKLFWRGRDSRRERLKLVEMGQNFPEMINASITAYFFFREEESRLGKSAHVSFFNFFDHKYQFNIDGTVAAYRLPYLLAGNAVVFKQESPYYEHFYSELLPWVHYIPVAHDLSDLLDRIKWAKENDEKVKQISINSQNFVMKHLLPHNILCYHAQLLSRWSKLLKNKVLIREGMEKVTKTTQNDRFKSCECTKNDAENSKVFDRTEL